MEIKEAVGILKGLQEPEAWEPQITEKTFEALDMAIMALERSDDKSRFFTLEYDFQYSIKVDRDTGVMYAVSNGNNNAGTFTPLINADGKPLIYKQIIKESDLVKMGVIEPGEIKAGKIDPIEQLKNLLVKAESEPPIIEGSVLEDLLVPVGLVKEIISEQPKQRWIPCSERVPSEEERKEWIDKNLGGLGYLYPCLVTRYSSINPDRTKNNPYVAKHYFDGEDFLNAGEEVRSEYIIAWMPLPEPYQEGEQAELLTGEWELKDHMWECNKCGCRINLKNPLDGNIWNYYFCPHCGTKMNIAVQRF